MVRKRVFCVLCPEFLFCPAPPTLSNPLSLFLLPHGLSCTQKNNSEVETPRLGFTKALGIGTGDSMRLLSGAFRTGGVREEPVLNLCSQD